MWFGLITLFPDMFNALQFGITGRAQKNGLIELAYFNPRDYTKDKHQSVDDHPYGGGAGMVMMAEPLHLAIEAATSQSPADSTIIFLSPQGRPFTQQAAATLSEKKSLILLAGRYEGIDERIIENEIDECWSIGDYILSGGELPAMVMVDTITRLLPDAVGDKASIETDSLTSGLLKYPQYTRPETYAGKPVPAPLLSGNHNEIRRWRQKQSLGKTWEFRKDLLDQYPLNREDKRLLDEYIEEFTTQNPSSQS